MAGDRLEQSGLNRAWIEASAALPWSILGGDGFRHNWRRAILETSL